MPTDHAKGHRTDPKPRPGRIVLARHGEPALDRKIKISAREYGDWWALYEVGGIKEGQTPPAHLVEAAGLADVIYSSTRRRSIETTRALVGEREIATDIQFIEAPLPPLPWPDVIRLSPKTWGFLSRVGWWLFHGHGQETRPQAEQRSRAVARRLSDLAMGGTNVLVVAHGYINAMISQDLRRLGWRCVQGKGWKYWSTRYFERP